MWIIEEEVPGVTGKTSFAGRKEDSWAKMGTPEGFTRKWSVCGRRCWDEQWIILQGLIWRKTTLVSDPFWTRNGQFAIRTARRAVHETPVNWLQHC
jgi:hypothetical protein